MSAKSTTKSKNRRVSKAATFDDCYLQVMAVLDFRLTVTARQNISVTPRRDSNNKPVVELCGTVNFQPTKKFAEQSARLVPCIKDGTHKLVNSIKFVPQPIIRPEDVICCCPDSGCAVMQVSVCPGC